MHTSTAYSRPLASCLLLAAATAAPLLAHAADPAPNADQVVVPQVERREVKLPKFPSKDIEIGLMVGAYSTPGFGASAVGGARLGYHLTEDFFVESTFAKTKVSEETYKAIYPAGVLDADKVSYYNVSVGYNVLPGEVFVGSNIAKASSIYLIGGVGSTNFNKRRSQTFNVGLGVRVLLNDRFALRVDMRDHMYSSDLLGVRQSKQNLELSTGIAFYF